MNISIIGSGYVGTVSAACFADLGHNVIAVDIDQEKVDMVNSKKPPIYEKGLQELLNKYVGKNLRATTDYNEIKNTEVTFICVGTPSNPDGSINLSIVKSASEYLGLALRDKQEYHVVVVKSTVVPETTEKVVAPIIRKYNKNIGFVMNPEFLREGNAVHDFMNPDRIVIGSTDKKSGNIVEQLYMGLDAPIIRTNPKTAEMVKYTSNSFLATKISFTNEIGNICKELGIDVYEVMKAVGLDFRISPYFLNAGAGFGGSCLIGEEHAIVKNPMGFIYLKTLKEIYEEIGDVDYEALSFDMNQEKMVFKKISAVTKRRYKGKLIKIRTRMNKSITVTHDHPFIVRDENQFKIKLASELKKGDMVPVFLNMPINDNNIQIDLIEELKKKGLPIDHIKIRPLNHKFKEYKENILPELKRHCRSAKKKRWRPYEVIRTNCMSINEYLSLEHKMPIKREDILLFTSKGNTTYVPAIINLDEDFCRLLGYYISEGHISSEQCKRGARKRIGFSFNINEKNILMKFIVLCHV